MKNNRLAWVSVPDLCELFPLSPNTNTREVELCALDAQEFDLPNYLTESLIDLIAENVVEKIQQWKSKSYNTGEKVFLKGTYYIALTTTTDNPENSNEWEVFEAMTFYYDYIKKYLCGKTMERYAPYVGLHMTQWGLEQYSQDSFSQVSDKRRSELLNQIKGKTNVYLYKMQKALKDVDYILDGVSYKPECTKKERMSFSVIGATNKLNYRGENNYRKGAGY
jgi:hypothetical protein